MIRGKAQLIVSHHDVLAAFQEWLDNRIYGHGEGPKTMVVDVRPDEPSGMWKILLEAVSTAKPTSGST